MRGRSTERAARDLLGSLHAEQGGECQNEPYPTSPLDHLAPPLTR